MSEPVQYQNGRGSVPFESDEELIALIIQRNMRRNGYAYKTIAKTIDDVLTYCTKPMPRQMTIAEAGESNDVANP